MRITKIGIPPGGDINQVLVKSSGTDYDVEWGTGSGTATPPGGLNTQVQFNDGGVFGGDSGFTYNKTTNRLTLGSLVLNDVVDPGVDTDKFLVLTSLGVVSYRNGASVLVDIGGVPTSRTLTINGTSYDLSSNRTWSVGTVESVGITAGTGINVSGSPITGSGSITVTNTAPDQTVSLTQGGTTTITGTYPNFTISSADQYVGTVTSIATSAPITGGTITGSGTIGITQASGSSDGYLSSTDWTTFNNKQNALTNPVTGTGTINYIPKFTATGSTIGNSNLQTDSSGNLGLGVTPSSWASPFKALEGGDSDNQQYIGFQTNANDLKIGTNHYYDGANYVYKFNGTATRYDVSNSSFAWNLAISGTAGQLISFTQAMTLDASGNLLVGSTSVLSPVSNYKSLVVGGTNGGILDLGTTTTSYGRVSADANALNIQALQAGDEIQFRLVNTQAMTLDASGNLLLGETSQAYLSIFTLSYNPVTTNAPIFLDNRAYGIDKGGAVWFGGKYNTAGNYRPFGGIAAYKENATDGNSAGYLVFYTNSNGADATDKMKLTSNGDLIIGSGADTGESLQVQGDAKISTIANATTDTDRFLVSDSGVIKYRTGTELRSDIGAEPTLTKGNLTEATSSILTITGGTGAVIGSGTSIEVKQASGSQSGYLSSTDWTTFNSKGSGSIGGSTGSTDNAVLRADGTGGATVQNSAVIINDNGDLQLGTPTSVAVGNRYITTESSAPNVELQISSKGSSRLSLIGGTDGILSGRVDIALTGIVGTYTTNVTNQVRVGLVARHNTTSTPANGIGTSIMFDTQTAALNNEVGSIIESVSTDVTSASEDFDLVFKTMSAGATAAERVRITSTGILNLAQGQIEFPATQNASTNVNTLDDYEEGVWTPTLLAETTNFTSVTYDSRTTGTYTKIGNTVFINGVMWTDAVNKGSGGGAAAGSIAIGGLPFTTSATGGKKLLVNVADAFAWLADEPLSGASLDSSTRFILYKRATSNGATTPVVVADVNTTADDNIAYFQGFYSV